MSTHILVRGLDPDLPATLSARVIRDVLRDRMGFTGPVITDCLEMGAIVKRWGVPAAALAATRAGHDLVLVCHTPERQRGAAARLEQALREGELDADENAAALARIATLRRDAKRAPLTADPARGAAVAATIAARALTRFGDAGGLLALDPEAPLRLVSVRPRSVVGAEEESNRDWGAWLRARAARVGFTRLAIEEIEPDDAVGARAVTERALAGGERILLFGWDARGHEGSRTLMLELARRAPDRLVVVHLRNPFDQALLGPGVTAVTAQGYTTAQIDALFAALAGRADWPGTMPAPLR